MKTALYCFLVVVFLTGCATHGAMKVAAGLNGQPWIVTNDGSIYAYNGSGWDQKEAPSTADDLAICGTFLTILTKADSQGQRTVKSRSVFGGAWTTYPSLNPSKANKIACDGYEPVVIATLPLAVTTFKSVYKYSNTTQNWDIVLNGAADISVMNGYLFYLSTTTTNGNVWNRLVNSGSDTQWGPPLVAHKIAGDANGLPWVATNATSNPLYKWDTANQKWTSGFASGTVYEMDIQDYTKMFILSDPQISGGGYTVYSHDLYSGGWTTYLLPSY